MFSNPNDQQAMPQSATFNFGENMNFDRGIWAETLRNFKANWVVVALVLGMTAVIIVLDEVTKHNSGSAAAMGWVFLAISAHTTILRGQSGPMTMYQKGVFGPFLWRGFLFSLLGLLGAVPFAGLFALAKPPMMVLGGIAIIAYFVCQALLLSKWGTWFPSVVAAGDKTILAAGRRGNVVFGYVFSHLFVCSILLWLVSAAISLAIVFMVIFIAILVRHAIPLDGILSVHDLTTWLFTFFGLLTVAAETVLVATILSRAYLIAETEMKKAPDVASAS